MAPALVVRRGAEVATRLTLEFEAVQERVEREIEVEARLFPIGDHVEPGAELIPDRRPDRVASRLLAVIRAELVEVRSRQLQPAGKRVAADDSRPDRLVRHYVSLRHVIALP